MLAGTVRVDFTKMHGAGNDFVIVDARRSAFRPDPGQCRFLSDRYTGIGFDQMLVIDTDNDCDAYVRIYNADGTEVGQCGNGLRCVAAWLARREGQHRVRLNGSAGITEAMVEAGTLVSTSLPVPDFSAAAAGCLQPSPVELDGEKISFTTVYLGNPHAVITVSDVAAAGVARLGAALQPLFSHGVNVGFSQQLDAHSLALRVFERGVGETRACGSGACAAAVVAMRRTKTRDDMQVHLPGGQLVVRWAGEGTPVWLRGPAKEVFEGRIEL